MKKTRMYCIVAAAAAAVQTVKGEVQLRRCDMAARSKHARFAPALPRDVYIVFNGDE